MLAPKFLFAERWARYGAMRFVLSADTKAKLSWPRRKIVLAPRVLWQQALFALCRQQSVLSQHELERLLPNFARHAGASRDEEMHRVMLALMRELTDGRRFALGVLYAQPNPSALSEQRGGESTARRLSAKANLSDKSSHSNRRPLTSLVVRNMRKEALTLAVRIISGECGIINYATNARPERAPLGAGALSFELWEPPWTRH